MNWKMFGAMLSVLALCAGIGGLFAGMIADASLSIQEQAHLAMGCFEGSSSACSESAEHRLSVAQWSNYGTEIAIGAGFLLIVGLSMFIAGKPLPPVEDKTTAEGNDDVPLSDDDLAKADAIERELALRGIRLD
jgi:hypothetical protein